MISPGTLGRMFVVLGACFLATNGIFSVFYYDHGGEATSLVFLRFAGAAFGFWLLAIVRRTWRFPPGLIPVAVGLSVLQFGTAWGLMDGFARAPVSLVILIFYLYPLIATVGAGVVLKEPLTVRKLSLLGLGVAGVALAVGVPGSAPTAGILLGLLACFCLGTQVVAGRYVMLRYGVSAVELLPLIWLGPTIALGAYVAVHGADFATDAVGWLSAISVITVGTFFAMMLFWTGVRRIGAGNAALLATVEPFVAVLLAVAILDETLTALQLVGGVMILTAVLLISRHRSDARAPISRTGRSL